MSQNPIILTDSPGLPSRFQTTAIIRSVEERKSNRSPVHMSCVLMRRADSSEWGHSFNPHKSLVAKVVEIYLSFLSLFLSLPFCVCLSLSLSRSLSNLHVFMRKIWVGAFSLSLLSILCFVFRPQIVSGPHV